MNLIMQQVLIKVIQSAQHFVGTLNHNFDEIPSIFGDVLKTLEAKAPNIDDYDNLTKIVNPSFEKSLFQTHRSQRIICACIHN